MTSQNNDMTSEEFLNALAGLDSPHLRQVFIYLDQRMNRLESRDAMLVKGFNIMRWAFPFVFPALGFILGRSM